MSSSNEESPDDGPDIFRRGVRQRLSDPTKVSLSLDFSLLNFDYLVFPVWLLHFGIWVDFILQKVAQTKEILSKQAVQTKKILSKQVVKIAKQAEEHERFINKVYQYKK